MLLGGVTAFFSATVAISQNDIKKVIAWSTVSQLGYMIFICGLSSYHVSMFHLVNHSFFKGLLFLCAGSIIHSFSGEQDMRRYGGCLQLVPYTYSMFLVGGLSLAGMPYLSGFYSKDFILEIAYATYTISGAFVYWLGIVTAGLTAFYSCRIVFLTFWCETNAYKYCIQYLHELSSSMGISLFILAIGSIFSGYLLKDAFIGIGSSFWGNSIYVATEYSFGTDAEFIPLIIKNIPIFFSFLGILLSVCFDNFLTFFREQYYNYIQKQPLVYQNVAYVTRFISLIVFLNKKWYWDYIYNYYIAYYILRRGYIGCYQIIDKGLIEILGVRGLSFMIYKIAKSFNTRQGGYIYQSICLLLLGSLLIGYLGFISTNLYAE